MSPRTLLTGEYGIIHYNNYSELCPLGHYSPVNTVLFTIIIIVNIVPLVNNVPPRNRTCKASDMVRHLFQKSYILRNVNAHGCIVTCSTEFLGGGHYSPVN